MKNKNELSISFKLLENEEEEEVGITEKEFQEDECDIAKLIKKLQRKQMMRSLQKIEGRLYAF